MPLSTAASPPPGPGLEQQEVTVPQPRLPRLMPPSSSPQPEDCQGALVHPSHWPGVQHLQTWEGDGHLPRPAVGPVCPQFMGVQGQGLGALNTCSPCPPMSPTCLPTASGLHTGELRPPCLCERETRYLNKDVALCRWPNGSAASNMQNRNLMSV